MIDKQLVYTKNDIR